MAKLGNLRFTFSDVKMRGKQVKHSPTCTFLGYVDATLNITIGDVEQEPFVLRIRDTEAKVLNGKLRIDFKSEKGSDGNFYPSFFPKSKASRTVLTHAMRDALKAHYSAQKRAA